MKCSKDECRTEAQTEDPGPLYAGLCTFHAWQAWFYASGGDYWDTVECVLCELDRDCPKHPTTHDRDGVPR